MMSTFRRLNLDTGIYYELAGLRRQTSDRLTHNEHSMGIGVMIGLLLDHWRFVPPHDDWLKARLAVYPKRGRPHKHEPTAADPVIALRKQGRKGHRLITGKAHCGTIYYCLCCTMCWNLEANPTPYGECPTLVDFGHYRSRKDYPWTREQLLEAKFDEEEIIDVLKAQERLPPLTWR